jgi:hypothetical protein
MSSGAVGVFAFVVRSLGFSLFTLPTSHRELLS